MKNQLSSKIIKFTTLLMVIFLNFSCKSYYKVDKEFDPTSDRLNELYNKEKYFIIHDNSSAYKLSNFKIKDGNLTGNTEILPNEHRLYILTSNEKKNQYKSKNKAILYEVHIYKRII